SSESDGFPMLLLPRLVGDLFHNDHVAERRDLMQVLAMQTPAMGCQLAFSGCLASARELVALARLPASSFLPLLLRAAVLVIVLGVGCPPLSIHPALQAAHGLGVRG